MAHRATTVLYFLIPQYSRYYIQLYVIMSLQRGKDMLAITSGAPEQGWQRQQQLIDSLAYVDTVTDEEKRIAQELIQDEMKLMNKRSEEYLEETPRFASVSSETSCSDGRPSDIRLDMTRYDLSNTCKDYNTSLDNARVHLEYQKARVVNLQLLQKYGPVSWRAHNEVLSATLQRTREDLDTILGDSNHINKERKMEQVAVAGEGGQGLEQEHFMYVGLVEKNAQILQACIASENQD